MIDTNPGNHCVDQQLNRVGASSLDGSEIVRARGAGRQLSKALRTSARALVTACMILWGSGCAIAQGLPTITTTVLPDHTVGIPYSFTLGVSGGTPPYSNWLVGGNFPPSLTLNSATGFISGTPTVPGVYSFSISVSDSASSASVPQSFVVTIAPPPSVASDALPAGILNGAYSVILRVIGGTAPYSNWAVTKGFLPPGLALNSATGSISGIPQISGFFLFTVIVQDADGVVSMPQQLSITIGLAVTTAALPNWDIGVPYSVQLTAAGGAAPYGSWTVASGTLPPGLTLDASQGLLSGVPAASGGFSFSITVRDAVGTTSAPQPFSILVAPAPVISTTSLPAGVVSVPYSVTLMVSGGILPATWTITSGTLPAGLSIFSSTGVISGIPRSATVTPFSFTVQATDSIGLTSTQQLSITVNQGSLTVSPGSVTFDVRQGDPDYLATQNLSVFSNVGPISYKAVSTTSSGGNWLTVSGANQTPGVLTVSVSTTGLSPNTPYKGQITITGATIPNVVNVPVTLNIASLAPPQLSVAPGSLAVNYAQGYAVDQRYLLVTNTGSGTLDYTAVARTDSCGSWLNLLNSSGTASVKIPSVIAVQIVSSGLADQTCTGKITVTSAAQSMTIPVTMTVSAQSQSVILSQTEITFAAAPGATAPARQSFSVLNAGTGPIDWTLDAQTVSGGNWLSATPGSGGSPIGNVPVPVTLSANPQGLTPGDYYGWVRITAPDAGNSPQFVIVVLTVAAQTPQLTPNGVILVGQGSTGNSQPELLTLTNSGTTPLIYASTIITDNHQNWLVQKPASGTLPAGGTASMTLQANTNGLPAGVQHATVRVAFADGTVHSVDVYLIVPGAGTTPGCSANGFVPVFQSPEPGFQVSARTPVPLQVLVKDCNSGKVVRRSNGLSTRVLIGPQNRTAVELIEDGNGIWTGTWTPSAPVSQLDLTARLDGFSTSSASDVSGQVVVSGTVNAAPGGAASMVTDVVNPASPYPNLVMPGSPVTLSGAGLGSAPASVNDPPLPTSLAGIQVLLQGQLLPLSYVDAKQVNAVVPAQITANQKQQLIVLRDGTIAAGIDVQVASPPPGLTTTQ